MAGPHPGLLMFIGARYVEQRVSDAVLAAGYDDLTAAEITKRLRDLSPAELRKVRDRERRGAARKSVLGAVEKRLAAA